MSDMTDPDPAPEPGPQYGPHMMALTEKQRRFVLAMASAPLDSAASWARVAGYSDHKERAKLRASELWADERVQAAVLELAKQTLGTIGPILAARQLIRIAADPKHKHHLRAVEMIANRTGLPEVEHIEIKQTATLTGDALVARVTELATKLGFNAQKLLGGNVQLPRVEPLMIEGKAAAAEVKDGPATYPSWCGLGKNGDGGNRG